jgi:RNA polymerase sigma-70 factor (ECF subfamily)
LQAKISRFLLNSVDPSNVDSSELHLVEQAARGEREARRELFERHRDAAFSVAVRITGRREDALDVVQDSFIKAFERLGDFQQAAGFRTWLLRIVTNRALDLLRARKVRLAVSFDTGDDEPRLEPPGSSRTEQPGADLERRELADRLQAAVESLPPEQRAVFALYATGEMTYGQIAEAVGIPIGTVMSRLYHARRRLHQLLEDLAPRGATVEEK